MKWPKLVTPRLCGHDLEVRIQSGISEDGEPQYRTVFQGRCSYSEKSHEMLDAERRLVRLEARALIDGDIAPGEDIAGEAVVSGAGARKARRIYAAGRGRNPDGTVNFTQLELM